jgi:hypothetical protein
MGEATFQVNSHWLVKVEMLIKGNFLLASIVSYVYWEIFNHVLEGLVKRNNDLH